MELANVGIDPERMYWDWEQPRMYEAENLQLHPQLTQSLTFLFLYNSLVRFHELSIPQDTIRIISERSEIQRTIPHHSSFSELSDIN